MAELKVRSEVTGIVVKVIATPGASVAAFDPLMLVESMKMEIPVSAPKAGMVVTIEVGEGESIAEGDVAATLVV